MLSILRARFLLCSLLYHFSSLSFEKYGMIPKISHSGKTHFFLNPKSKILNRLSSMVKLEFSKDFLWGAATSSHQVEGNNHNDWTKWEKENAERLAKESKQSFLWNPHWKKFKKEATNPENYISGIACDHYHRFNEDFDLAQSLSHNAHRFSIEWSRIEPSEGDFDEKEIEHYRQIIGALQKRGIEPFVTLWHWTLPLWLAEKGGMISSEFPKYFDRYTEKIVEALGNGIQFWITLNEPDVVSSHAYLKGAWPPQKKNPFLYLRAICHLISAHRRAYTTIKKLSPTAQIGIAKHQVAFEMARPTFINHILKAIADWSWNAFLLNRIRNHQDFIGLNHYNRNIIDNGFGRNPNATQTDLGWEYHPDSIYQALVELKSYKKPIYITENGIADSSDELRQKFIPTALSAVHRAIRNGIDVRGYFYWSLLDNLEWDKGYWPRFGLIAVDFETEVRTPRPSALLYANICRNNALSAEDRVTEK